MTTAELLLVIANVLLFLVARQSANAAKQNAELAAREYRLLRRPLATVTWNDPPNFNDVWLHLSGNVSEVAGVRTRIHSLIAEASLMWVDPTPDPPTRIVQSPSATLSGDVAIFPILLSWKVPLDWPGDPAEMPPDANFAVANIEVRLVISVDVPDAAQETWLLTGMLTYDPRRKRYVVPRMTARCVSEGEHGHRSRALDPVLRAWQRWWDSVC